MKSIRFALAALLALSLVALAGCADSGVAAKVNGEKITTAELDAQVEQLKKQYPQMFEGADGEGRLLDFKQRLLDSLINQKLLEQASKDKKIEITDADIDKQVEQLKAGFQDEEQFDAALKSAGMDAEGLKKQIREQLLTQKLIESLAEEADVPEADLKAYFENNQAQFEEKAGKRASHILFKPEDKADAEKVLAQVKSGGDFAALATENSVDTATSAKGGDLGWPTTPYVAEFEEALAKLDKGETSSLVKTPYGWHIIRVTDERKATRKKFEDVKEQIKQILIQQQRADAYQKFLDDLRDKAKIEILIDELKPGATPKASEETTPAASKETTTK